MLGAVLMASAVLASGAAAKSIDVGPGGGAHVAVDSKGSAYFGFTQTGSPDKARYCKLPHGAKHCAVTIVQTPGPPADTIDGGSYVFPLAGGRVLFLDGRCCVDYNDEFLYTSIDGGKTFGAPVQIGSNNINGSGISGNALYSAPNQLGAGAPELILTINGLQTVGAVFQASLTTGPPGAGGFPINGGAHSTFTGSIALQSGQLVAAYTNDNGKVYWRKWNGVADINQSSSWTPPALVGNASIDSGAQLAGGPGGIFLAYNTGNATHEHWVLRKFNGGGFGAAKKLSDQTSGSGALATDPSGRVYFAWRDAKSRLRYRFTKQVGGLGLSSPRTLGPATPKTSYVNLDLAVASGGKGVASWDQASPASVHAVFFKR
jgi:hypothetical protein